MIKMHSIGKLFLTVLLVLLLFTGCSTADAYPPSATESENLAKFSLGLVIDPEETLNFQQWMIEAVQNAGLPVNVKGFTQKQIASITADCAANTPDNLRECVQLQTQTDVLAVLYSLPNDDGSMTVLAEIITPNYDWLYQQVWPAGTQDKSTFANSTVYFSTLQHSLSSPDNDVMAWLKENRAKVFFDDASDVETGALLSETNLSDWLR